MVEFKVKECFRLGVANLRPSEHSGGDRMKCWM